MIQIQALCKILAEKSVELVYQNDLTSEHFQGYADHFDFIMNHYKQYGNVPDLATFLDKFPEFTPIEVAETDEYLVEKLNEELQCQKFIPIIMKTHELLQSDSIAAIDYMRSQIREIEEGGPECGVDIIKQAHDRYESYEQKKNSDGTWFLPSGFKEIDDAIGGLAPGEEFVVFFARTNQGKSWALAQTATINWKVGNNVGFVSPEMSYDMIGYRFDTLNEHFPNFELYAGRPVDNYEKYILDLMEMAGNSFRVATPQDFNKRITVSKLRKFCNKYKLDILCIDGIKYLSDERYKRGDNLTTSLTNISEDLISLSIELHIPIVVVVQANRDGVEENGEAPSLESIRDSDGIAQNATKVFSLRQHNNKLKIKIAKCRTGKVGTTFCYDWDINVGKFEYNSSPEEMTDVNTNQSRYTGRTQSHEPAENKQPLRRGAAPQLPF